MNPTFDWLEQAEKQIRLTLQQLRPKLLETQGITLHRLKDDKTAVTEMDVLVEETLKQKLAQIDSSIAFSGEETGTDYSKQTFWLVDPIDGTEAFIRGLPFATNMITLIDNDQPVMSVIYNFSLDEYFLAIKGHGASRNGHPIRVSSRPLDRSSVVLAGRVADKFGRQHNVLRKKVCSLPRMNASGYEHSALARGAIDAAIAIGSKGKPWDFAPGSLLIQEAGGRVENIDTPGTYNYRNTQLLAANPVIFDELLEFVSPLVIE